MEVEFATGVALGWAYRLCRTKVWEAVSGLWRPWRGDCGRVGGTCPCIRFNCRFHGFWLLCEVGCHLAVVGLLGLLQSRLEYFLHACRAPCMGILRSHMLLL